MNRNRLTWISVAILTVLSFFVERINLMIDYSSVKYWIIKISLMIILYFILCGLGKLHLRYTNGNREERIYIKNAWKVFLTILIINLVVLLLIWPGMWGGDELWLLPTVRQIDLSTVQHWLVAYWYILSMMMIPVPSGIIIIMIIFNSYVSSSLFYEVQKKLNYPKLAFLLLIPFCSFQILLFNQFPLRGSIYGNIEILFFVYLYRIARQDKVNSQHKIKIIILASIIISLRSEAVYYLLVIFIILICLTSKKNDFKKYGIIIFIGIIVLAMSIGSMQKNLTLNVGDRNTLTAIIDPLAELTKKEAELNEDWRQSKELIDIDNVISVDILTKDGTGSMLMWENYDEFFKSSPPSANMKFYKAYILLILKHPKIFFEERYNSFIQVQNNNVLGQTKVSMELFSPDGRGNEPIVLNKDLYGFDIINYNVYCKTLKILALDSVPGNLAYILRTILFTIWVPCGALIIGCMYFLFKKKYIISMAIIGILLKVPLIFLTAPGESYMYYYPVYLVGIIGIVLGIIGIIDKRKPIQGGKDIYER
ncbi:hypothetical protein ACTFIN_02835 [Clostridium cagae]|uniref:hypothetical protein n=1 Tax=Clostridium cagae TaxID=2080751 RepID=UPI003F76A89F